MHRALRSLIMDSPFEKIARRLFLRLDNSSGGKSEKYILPVMKIHLNRNSNCIDIGAHRGAILQEITTLSPEGQHYAFEPLPQHFYYLVKNFPKVKILRVALSNVKTERSFTHVIDRPTRSGFLYKPSGEEKIEIIKVSADLIDNILPISMNVDFIKVDVEGAEYEVFLGGEKTISKNRPLIYFEHSPFISEQYGHRSSEIFDFLVNQCGLKIWLPQTWLRQGSPLSISEFLDITSNASSFNFIAHYQE